MSVSRRFLIAPSLTRLIRTEFGSEQVREGHFAPQFDRQSHVRIQGGAAHLILRNLDADPEAEDWTDLPLAHAEALLTFCPGTVVFERSVVPAGESDALIDRFVVPGPLDRVTVEFATPIQAATFIPPLWFGPEISEDQTYKNWVIALSGLPPAVDTQVSNMGLEAVLDILEGAPGLGSDDASAEGSTVSALDRLATVARQETLPAHTRVHGPKHASPAPQEQSEQLSSVIKNLAATLSNSTTTGNGSVTDLKRRPKVPPVRH